jgi:DNA-binding transcriptional ArsR family regulator
MVKYYKDDLSHVFYALADRNRRQILELVTKKPRKASDLARRFDISFPAVSRHIRILEEAGFVKRKITGREHEIDIQQKSLDRANEWITAHRQFWMERLDRLEGYLEKTMKEENGHEHKEK